MQTIIDFFRRGGRPDDFSVLLAPHIEHLYRLAYRFTGSRDDAEDLVQDLLVHLYPRTDQLTRVERLKPWLARALYNRFIDGVRRARRDPLEGADDETRLADGVDPGATPDVALGNAELQQRLATALATLGPEQRALVSLHDIEGYTLGELQNLLETPVGTLKSRLHRSRRQLRVALLGEPSGAHRRVKD